MTRRLEAGVYRARSFTKSMHLPFTTTKTVCKSHNHFTIRGVDDPTPLTVGWLYKEF
jgi:hypothetical protein